MDAEATAQERERIAESGDEWERQDGRDDASFRRRARAREELCDGADVDEHGATSAHRSSFL